MSPIEFCYWLQGAFELRAPGALTTDEVQCIKNHLNLVFVHAIDPATPDPDGKLQAATVYVSVVDPVTKPIAQLAVESPGKWPGVVCDAEPAAPGLNHGPSA